MSEVSEVENPWNRDFSTSDFGHMTRDCKRPHVCGGIESVGRRNPAGTPRRAGWRRPDVCGGIETGRGYTHSKGYLLFAAGKDLMFTVGLRFFDDGFERSQLFDSVRLEKT